MLSSSMTVSDPRAAAVFALPARRHLLFAFIGRERTLSEVARDSGASLSLLHYHARRLFGLGLIREVGVVRRAGRPMKKYAAAASEFVVAGELLEGSPGFGLRRELHRVLEAQDAAADSSWVFFRDDRGGMRMRQEGAVRRPVEYWRVMALDEAELAELSSQLQALLTAFAQRPSRKGAKSHLVHAAAVPWDSGFVTAAEGSPTPGRAP